MKITMKVSLYMVADEGLDAVGWYGYNNGTGTTGSTSSSYLSFTSGTHEVGQKKAKRLGLYDMIRLSEKKYFKCFF